MMTTPLHTFLVDAAAAGTTGLTFRAGRVTGCSWVDDAGESGEMTCNGCYGDGVCPLQQVSLDPIADLARLQEFARGVIRYDGTTGDDHLADHARAALWGQDPEGDA